MNRAGFKVSPWKIWELKFLPFTLKLTWLSERERGNIIYLLKLKTLSTTAVSVALAIILTLLETPNLVLAVGFVYAAYT